MIPIDQMLNRIRWDNAFGNADFVIGYYDRVDDAIIRVPLTAVIRMSPDHRALELLDAEGVVHSVPLHRIRELYRNGELIWQRPAPRR